MSKKSRPILSIIVPVLNQSEKTIKCFASIRANTPTPFQLVWISNGCKADHYSRVRYQATRPRMDTVLIRNKTNLGFVKAINQGIKEARGDFCILLNNDTEVTWGWERQLLKPFRNEDQKIGAVGPLTNSPIGWQGVVNVERRWKLGLPKYEKNPVRYAKYLQKKFDYRYVAVGGRKLPLSFFCCCLPKKIFQEIGGLDENFGLGIGDDDDFAMRMSIYGYKQMLSLGSFVMHHHRTTFRKELKLEVDSIRRHSLKVLRRNAKKYKKMEKSLRRKETDQVVV